MLRAPRWGANGNVTYYTYDHLGQQTSVSVPAQPTSEEGWLEFGSDTTQSATSTYQYSQTGLTPGMYEVLVNWVADPSLDHYAGYGVSAPGQFIGYDVDQRQSPDPSGLNGGWYSLGDILVTGNELDMSLSGDRLAPTYVGDWEIIRVSNVATITTYDADGRVTGTTDPLANTTSYSYNALGEKTVENDPNPNDGGWTAQETFTYNADGQMLTSTETPNAGGIVDTTNYSYDHLGRQTSVSSPSITIDNSSASGYGSSGGFSLTASDPEPQPSGYNGNSVLFGDGTATWTFDDVDPGEYEVLATWQPFSNASNSAAYEIIDGSNVLGTATVDQTQSPNGSLQAGWQQLGAQFTVASGTLVVQLPSIAGQLVEADAIRLVRVSDQTTYTYNALGTQTSETDADGNLTTFAYNSIGQLLSETDPTGGVTSYTYDNAGQQTTVTDPDGRVTAYTYDNLGRTVAENFYASAADYQNNPGNPEETLSWIYDSEGTLAISYDYNATTEGLEDTSYSYDTLGRVAGESGSGNFGSGGLAYTFDANGNVLTEVDGTTVITYSDYNGLNLPASETVTGSGLTTLSIAYTYSTIGQVLQTQEYQAGALVDTTTYTYDGDGNLTDEIETDASGNVLDSFTYGINGEEQIINTYSPAGGFVQYGYDAAGQLTGATYAATPWANESYTYDAAGNRQTTTTGTAATDTLQTTTSTTTTGNQLAQLPQR